MCTNVIVFIQEEKETVGICTNVIVFLQEEKETRHQYTFYCFSSGGERFVICTNVIVFVDEEKETVDICTNFIVFRGRNRLHTFVLMLVFFFRR